jgi:2-haloacid dehalogenase
MSYTLAFDVYGTLINTSGIHYSLQKLIDEKATPFMEMWRHKQLEYSFRRGLMNLYVDFSVCTYQALEYCCAHFKIELTTDQKNSLIAEYRILPAFGDVEIALVELKKSGHKLFAFSNGSHEAVSTLLSNAKIIQYFEGVVSMEDIKTFKPNPIGYAHFNNTTNSEKANTWLVSSNPFDIIGAKSYGMQAAWVQRSEDTVFDPWDIQPDMTVRQLNELRF